MSQTKIILNTAGVRELLRSDEMKKLIAEHAETIRQRCGDGYTADSYLGKNRWNSKIQATTHKARRDNAKNNTILKAVRG